MIRLVIADDHQIFIDALRSMLSEESDIEIMGTALDGLELLTLLAQTRADVILMDVNMPRMNGLEATTEIVKKYPNIKILVLSMHDTGREISGLLEAGAKGYVLKNTGRAELVQAIRTVASGKPYYSADVTTTIMTGLGKIRESYEQENITLSKREKEILTLIVEELTTHEIADRLFISPHTVETHRKNLLSKIGVKNTAGLVKYAIVNKLVEEE